MSRQTVSDIYSLLHARYGPQYWWPGQTQFEIIAGAILTQNTNWQNVEKALANLKAAGCLSAEKLHAMDTAQLAQMIRPAGYYNIKAQRLKSFLDWLFGRYGGDLSRLEQVGAQTLREQLLAIRGIGPETADSICLYAFGKPVFVVDAYTARIFGRHGLIDPGSGYAEIQEVCQSGVERDAKLYNEFHALLVRLGKDHCKPKPICKGCPLEHLPHVVEPEY